MSCDLDLAVVLAIVTLILKILSRLYLGNHNMRRLILSGDMVRESMCATSWCDLDLTFDLDL